MCQFKSTIPDILRKEEVILVDFKHFAMGHIAESVADEGIHHSDLNKFFDHSMEVKIPAPLGNNDRLTTDQRTNQLIKRQTEEGSYRSYNSKIAQRTGGG